MKNYIAISDIDPTAVDRRSTGYPELDWLYGVSRFQGEKKGSLALYFWGLPIGKISMWAGESGVGKSRLAISMAKLSVMNGNTVLYFQNEVDLSTFASWVQGSRQLKNFFCSEATALKSQLEIIEKVKPKIIFVDSINLIDEFGTGRDADVREIIESFRNVISKIGSHVIFLCQLNKDGSAKGSTSLTHMPDISFILTNVPEGFKVSVDKKHRYGRTGPEFFSLWRHIDSGVECLTQNRYKDKKWCLTTGHSFINNNFNRVVHGIGAKPQVIPSAGVLEALRILAGRKDFLVDKQK
jgi:hypothetical protein